MKLKYYLVMGAIVLLGILASVVQVQRKKIQRQSDRIDRLLTNVETLLDDTAQQTALFLTQRELTGKVLAERDSLANALKIRPRTITKFIDRIVTQHDTTEIMVPVRVKNDTTFIISDIQPCYTWEGTAVLTGDSLIVKRNLFDYHNKITEIFFWKRNFPIFGKKKFFQQTSLECGSQKTKEINILRK